MPSEGRQSAGAAFRVLRRPQAPLGIAAVTLLFMGQFALFTYLRPFLERVTQVNVSAISLILLLIGAAGFIGSWLIGFVLRTRLYGVLVTLPLLMAAIALSLIWLGRLPIPTAALLTVWGLVATAAPVAWWTWLSKVLPDDAEAGGGLMVAAIQLAITLGAASGGFVFDRSGHGATFALSAALLCASALLAFLGARNARQAIDRRS
jgi:predicted MFS family arabinose efflux permease